MSEQTLRRRVVKTLRVLDAVSVENPAYPGTPDVNYVEGWIELKWVRRWPRNADKEPLRIDHFTPQQRRWLDRRWKAGGNVFLLLQVEQEYYLFDGSTAAKVVGRVCRAELYVNAVAHWHKGLNKAEFIKCLSKGRSGLLPRRESGCC